MIDANGRLVVSSRILFAVERQRDQRIHEQRLLKIAKRRPRRRKKGKKGARNAGKFAHILENRKGKFMKAQENEEIKRVNRLLLGKLKSIFKAKSKFDEMDPSFTKPRSMNIYQRRKELMRINRENKAMVRRLESVEATMSAQRLADEDKVRRADRARLRQFIPTVDVYVHSQSIADQKAEALFSSKPTMKAKRPPKKGPARRGRPESKGRRIKLTDSVLESEGKGSVRSPQSENLKKKSDGQVGYQDQDVKMEDEQQTNQKEELQQQQDLERLFNLIDTNGDGIISYRELLQGAQNEHIRAYIDEIGNITLHSLLQPKHMKETMKKIASTNIDDELNLESFLAFCKLTGDSSGNLSQQPITTEVEFKAEEDEEAEEEYQELSNQVQKLQADEPSGRELQVGEEPRVEEPQQDESQPQLAQEENRQAREAQEEEEEPQAQEAQQEEEPQAQEAQQEEEPRALEAQQEEEEEPQAQEAQQEEEEPQAQEEEPQAQEEEPQAQEEEPQAKEDEPQAQEDEPQAQEEEPQAVKEISSKSGKDGSLVDKTLENLGSEQKMGQTEDPPQET